MLECDEYPWAASEEGGNYLPESRRSRLCVPRVQNNYGGQCIEMLSNLQSNVGKMEPVDPPKDKKRVDMWASWYVLQHLSPLNPLWPVQMIYQLFLRFLFTQVTNSASRGQSDVSNIWYTTDDVGGVQNRLTEYDNPQPVPVGWDPRGWAATGNGDRTSWVFKRNYTFDIVDDASDGTGLWDATGKRLLDTSATIRNANGYGSVLCAVNTFGQDEYYKYPRDASNRQWNALCYKLPMSTRMFLISLSLLTGP